MAEFKKQKSGDFEINRSEIFNSDYYFDDIIEELSESGLYSGEYTDEEKDKSDDDDNVKNEISEKMTGIKDDLGTKIQKIEQKLLNFSEMFFNLKSELIQTIQKMQNNLLLMKFETEEGIGKVSSILEDKIANDSVKEKAFEELYSQLESYKRNFVFSAMKPVILDMLLLYDRIENEICHKQLETANPENDLVSYRDELLEILCRNDVIPMEVSNEGDKFNPEKSNAVDKCETDDPDLDGKICKVLKVGFKRGVAIIRPEIVQVYKSKAGRS